jgi:hypothetical protein
MSDFVTYSASITATNNSTAVTGSATAFVADGVRAGDIAFFIESTGPVGYPIASVESATGFTLSTAYKGSTGGSKTIIVLRRWDQEKASDTYRLINSYVQSLEDTISVSQAGIRYVYSNVTTMALPATGAFRLNNATASSVTAIAINDLSGETGNPDASAFINAFDDSSAVVKGFLYIKKAGAPETFMVYGVTGLTDNSGWSQLAVTYITGNGSLANDDPVRFEFYRTGNDGFEAGTRLTYSTTTTDADPGTGAFRFNNATFASITQIFIDNADVSGNAITALLDLFDDSTTSAARGIVRLQKTGDPTVYRDFTVNGAVVDGTGYRKVPVTPIQSAGTWTNGDPFSLTFFRTGNAGADGYAPGFRYTYNSTTTDSDPGSGTLRLNNGTHSSATFAYVDNLDGAGATITTWLDALDDSTQSNHKGYLRIQKANDPAIYREYVVTGAIVDGTGYRKIPLSHVASAGVLSSSDAVVVTFSRTGNAGSDGIQPGYRYLFSTTTTDSDPGAGTLRANNATFGSITQLFIDNADAAGATVTTWLDSLDDSTSEVKGTLRIEQLNAPTTYREFNVTGTITDGTGYRKVTVTPISSNGTLSDGASIVVTWFRAGDQGTSVLSDGDKGDISITGGVWSIDSQAVTNAKLADMAASTIKGVSIAGQPQDLTAAQARSVMSVSEALTAARTYYVRAALPQPSFTGGSANVSMTAHGLSVNDPVILAIPTKAATCTITAASPAVVTRVAHGFSAGQPIKFDSTGYLPTGITAGTTYYVIATGLATDSFRFSATVGGAAINTSAISSSFTNASATITSGSAHGLKVGQLVRFAGSVATNFTAGVDYYVTSTGTATTFTVSATNGGTNITAGSTVSGGTVVQTGTHYVECAGAMPTFSTAGLLVAGTVYYVGIVVDGNTVTLSTTINNANPLGTATVATGSPVYAAATGNDSNDGLTATRAGAFLTIQKAIDTVSGVLIGANAVTIQLADGTHIGGGAISSPWLGTGSVVINGNSTFSSNVVVTSSGFTLAAYAGKTSVSNFQVQSTSVYALVAFPGGSWVIGAGMRFGTTTNTAIVADGGYIYGRSNYTIVNNGVVHWGCANGGFIDIAGITITIIGTPAFSFAFASVAAAASTLVYSNTFVGSATGTRYSLSLNGIINTNGGGASYFPGNSAGTPVTGGQYI